MKKLIAMPCVILTLMLVGCSANNDNPTNSTPKIENPVSVVRFGETFAAEITTAFDEIFTREHMRGQYLIFTNHIDGWTLDISWRLASYFFGDVPKNWEEATEDMRNEYFAHFLLDRNGLESNHEIYNFNVPIRFVPPAPGIEEFLGETSGKKIQFVRGERHVIGLVIGFYSLCLQSDNEGAFFIEFRDSSENGIRFEENLVVFEKFFRSIELQRFYR